MKHIDESEWEDGGLVEVDATGMGSVLFNMEVFQNIDPPWFEWLLKPGEKPIGEDISFWHKVKEAGYRIFVDCDIKVGHITQMAITEDSYWAYKYSKSI